MNGSGREGGGGDCGHLHLSHRAPWLRAALLGAQDGLVSVASLMVGVSAVQGGRSTMVVSGLAGQCSGLILGGVMGLSCHGDGVVMFMVDRH